MNITAYKLTKSDYTSIFAEGKYTLTYTPGTIVTALPTTLGIMLFKDKYQIYNLYGCCYDYSRFKLLKVDTIAPIHSQSIVRVSPGWSECQLDEFYTGESTHRFMYAPNGTICCYKIHVLEEVPLPCSPKQPIS